MNIEILKKGKDKNCLINWKENGNYVNIEIMAKEKQIFFFSFLFWVNWKDKMTRVHLLVSHQANE